MLVAYYKSVELTPVINNKRLKTPQNKRIKNMVKIAKEWREKGFNTKLSISKNEALLEVHDE